MAGLSSFATFERLTQERHAAIEEAYQKFCASGPADIQTALAVIQGYRGPACRDFARVARYFDLSVARINGCAMGQVLHGGATTTEAIRRAIQHSQECKSAPKFDPVDFSSFKDLRYRSAFGPPAE
jgi:hypothetical protein